jgi:uncharacterized membrane protein YkoI
MLKLPFAVALAALASGAALAAPPAHGPKPKLTLAQARTIALRAAPGRVMSAEYEKEGGGWRYSFDIQQRGHVQEIGVDGATGRIVENKSEGKVDHD